MQAYLDNAATTFVFPEVKNIMVQAMEVDYGNPSSMHQKGIDAENYIKTAKEQLTKEMKVEPKEIVFTSGGTESNNMALIGAAMANQRKGRHIISSAIEHASVYNPLIHLEEQGFEVTYLPVDKSGTVRLDRLKEAIREDTILVSIMYVNNEIGSIQPIAEISQIIQESGQDILFHVDAIQAFGKLRIYPKRLGIDLMSISGHKIHGPKGSGVLFIKDKTRINPIIFGGGQQKNMRSGTENVPGIAGIGLAAQLIYQNHEQKTAQMQALKERFLNQISALEEISIYSGQAPHIISVSFPGIRSEVLLHALEEKNVFVSSGSACASNHPAISGTLKAIGLDKAHYESTLRFSLSIFTMEEEIDQAATAVCELVPVLRRFTRR